MPPTVWVCGGWCAGVGFATAVLPGQGTVGFALGVTGLLVLGAAVRFRPAIVPLILAAACFGVARAEAAPYDPSLAARAAAFAGRSVAIEGQVADDPRAVSGGEEIMVTPARLISTGGDLPPIGNLLVVLRGPGEVALGDNVDAYGKLSLPADVPGFDRRAYLAQEGAYLELHTTQLQVAKAPGPQQLPGTLRQDFLSAISTLLPQPHAAVLAGIVLGIRQGIPPDLQQDLVTTGLVHLLVLSGLKVSVFARLALAALRPLLGHAATVPAITLVILYVLVGGATPSAIRSGAMGILAIVAARLGRQTHVWTSLAVVAAAMAAWRPDYTWDVGFQLSFAGTVAIILMAPAFESRLGFLPGGVREALAVTAAAQVGTVPLMATDFHVLSLTAPLANALALPLLPFLVAGGLLVAPFATIPALGRVLSLPIAGVVIYLEQVAHVCARLPAAAVSVPQFPPWSGASYYSGLAGVLVATRLEGRRRWAAVALGALVPSAIGIAEVGAELRPMPSAAVLAVGDGQAVLLTGPQGRVLIDGGPSPAALTAQMGEQMPPWRPALAALIVTAPTAAHVGGLGGFRWGVRRVLIPAPEPSGTAFRTVVLAAQASGAAAEPVAAGEVLTIAGLSLQMLAPERTDPRDMAGVGEIGLRAVAPDGGSFCDLSDLDPDAQLVASARLGGPCDYLLLPSGARSEPSPALMTAARPRWLIASTSGGRLARGLAPAQLRRTDQEGTIVLPL